MSYYARFKLETVTPEELVMYTSEFNLTLLNRSQRAIDRLSTRRVSLFYNSKIGQDANDAFYTAQNYFFGRHNFDQDFVKAFKYYREAAELGHGLAVTLVGFCYEFGYGASIDYSKAEKYYMVALESYVEPFALCRMAFLRKYGRPGIKIDILEAEILAERLQEYKLAEPVKWLVYAAETYQNSSAQYCLGVCYHDGFGVDVNLAKAVYYYELSANQGHARGQGILGYCYAEGVGVQKNPVASFRWYMKAAQQAECVAMYNVGFCLEDGVGCKKDLAEAFYWYSKSAELGNCFAQNSLGYFYEEGIYVEKNHLMAFKYYLLAGEQGYPWAQCNLGYCCQQGIGCEIDMEEGAKWYLKAALQNHSRAIHNLGYCYQHGLGVPKDLKKALEWYYKAAEQKNTFALHSCGYCYQNGIGVEKDDRKAFSFFYQAAELDHAPAMLSLGLAYRQGSGCEKDDVEALKWFLRAAELGLATAQNSVGYAYEEGIGTSVDIQKAVKWYKKAAEQENLYSMCNLASLLIDWKKNGLERNDKYAFELLLRSSELGLHRSMNKLGHCYENGIGTDIDLSTAFSWYLKASEEYTCAYINVAKCYDYGIGVERDTEKAIEFYSKSAVSGNRTAAERMLSLLTSSNGISFEHGCAAMCA